jgi:hypothetical protein
MGVMRHPQPMMSVGATHRVMMLVVIANKVRRALDQMVEILTGRSSL